MTEKEKMRRAESQWRNGQRYRLGDREDKGEIAAEAKKYGKKMNRKRIKVKICRAELMLRK